MTLGHGALAIAAALGGWLCVVLVHYNWARFQLKRLAATLPLATRREILKQIDAAGAEAPAPVWLLRAASEEWPATFGEAWIGGEPELGPGTSWPRDAKSGEPARFLAQITLQSPPLTARWSGRSVALFLVNGIDTQVRAVSFDAAPPTPAASRPSLTSHDAPERTLLSVVRLPPPPSDAEAELSRYASSALLARIPAVETALRPYAARPERLLPYVLLPDAQTWELDSFMVSLMGGEPELIQGEHASECPACSAPLQFLFQLGDVLGIGGDAPIVYVYGCEAQLEHVAAFVDMH